MNDEIISKCKLLSDYSIFVSRVHYYIDKGDKLDEAVRKAVLYCCKNNVLTDFLEENAKEVIGMLMTEWNMDDAKKVWYEEGIEAGIKEGSYKTARNALAEGSTPEFVQKITGLTIEEIKNLA